MIMYPYYNHLKTNKSNIRVPSFLMNWVTGSIYRLPITLIQIVMLKGI